jgi:hypothetical protein
VRLLHEPLHPYERYECEWGYALTTAAGEEVRVLREGEHPIPVELVDHGYWLLDDTHPVRMHYADTETPAYALAVFTAHNSRPSRPANADRPEDLAAVRAERFRRLTAEQHRMWKLVMTEAALNWHVRSPELMVEQMGFLIDASRLPNVRLGIIPSRAPARVFAPHGFDMYDSRGVCIGTKTATALTTDAGDIADYEALFGELEQMAVHDDEARTLIARVATDYRALADRERRADERAQSQGVPDAPAPTSDSQPAHS